MHKQSQAALEFLPTYVWAFLVIAITIGSLYYFGILDFGKYLPQKCSFPSQFKCIDFSLKPNQVRIRLTNNLGEDIRVTSLSITDEASTPMSCTAPSAFDWVHSTETDIVFSSCTGGGYIAGTRVDLKVTINYYAVNTPSRPNHLINGKINGNRCKSRKIK